METMIKRRVSPNEMIKIFDLTDKINVRFYEPVSKKDTFKSDFDKPIMYKIRIRHADDISADNLFNCAVNYLRKEK